MHAPNLNFLRIPVHMQVMGRRLQSDCSALKNDISFGIQPLKGVLQQTFFYFN